ncbi:zinc metalloproteinase [Niveomyces insectorum RCEF 264]|uniref:Zinc metalloproteinase n=1 Tax=Niveomyces insectorum RCEF 264 TaxID=1081102 RepID=A0A167PS37_9HYPO|nr:zinc metalloproteinase [Niveomyces insectorum RCEF 264]
MPPSFLSFKLRRKSRASIRTEKSTDTSSEASHSHGHGHSQNTTPTSGSLTPPSIAQQSDPALHLQINNSGGSASASASGSTGRSGGLTPPPPIPTNRPTIPPSLSSSSLNNGANKRYSVSGMAGLGSPIPANGGGSSNRLSTLPVSPFSPRIHNIADNAWVYQKVLIVTGTIGDPGMQGLDGNLTVSRLDDGFPPTQWPVSESHFKALVYLMPGANRLRFDFASPKLANSGTSNPIHASYLTLHMVPPMGAPPLQLAILLAKDSPGTFDAVPARVEREGNGLDVAIRKFRMAAYLWQAFTAEQMWRNRLGRRVFRFEEEWTQGTSNLRDREYGLMRSEARIHVIRTDKTLAELRDPDNAQQNGKAKHRDAMYGIAVDAVRNYFQPKPGQALYVSVLLLDAHWDKAANLITAHAALGGGAGDLRVAVFGSHCLQSYPTSFEEVVPAFGDCTPTDPNYVANDANESGSSWEACNIGIGAHLHETGHLLGLPHRESGVMLRDYVRLNRSFLTREAYSTRTKSKGGLVVLDKDECTWHRLDCLHFRRHPCFRLPNDPPAVPDESVQAWPIEGGCVALTAASGVAYLELHAQGDSVCSTWIEYPLENGAPLQRQVVLTEQELRSRLPEAKRKKDPIRVKIHAWGGGDLQIEDVRQLVSKESVTKLGGGLLTGKTAFRSCVLGRGAMQGTQAHEVIFASAQRPERVLSRVIVYHGRGLDGMEFVYDDDSRQLFGKRGGKPGGDSFDMDVRRGEYISGFNVRCGFWVDGVQILTSMGRRSPFYGNAHGGSAHALIPPRGYTICGVSGSCAAWVDSFAVLITK